MRSLEASLSRRGIYLREDTLPERLGARVHPETQEALSGPGGPIDYDDLGHAYGDTLVLRLNGKRSAYTQFWTAEEPGFYVDGEQRPQEDWIGLVRCGVCGRPLDDYKPVYGPRSEEFEISSSFKADRHGPDHVKWVGWAWKVSHPGMPRPGRPQEFHEQCRLMLDGWDRWTKAEMRVRFDPVYGGEKIKEWQAKLQQVRNTSFGSSRFSPEERKRLFGRPKRDDRPRAERKTKRVR